MLINYITELKEKIIYIKIKYDCSFKYFKILKFNESISLFCIPGEDYPSQNIRSNFLPEIGMAM